VTSPAIRTREQRILTSKGDEAFILPLLFK
jgi:hypothetical protein